MYICEVDVDVLSAGCAFPAVQVWADGSTDQSIIFEIMVRSNSCYASRGKFYAIQKSGDVLEGSQRGVRRDPCCRPSIS